MVHTSGMRKPFQISIHMGIASAFLLLILLTSTGLSTVLFLQVQRNFREELRKQMQSTVGVGALAIDLAKHQAMQSPADEASPAYRELKATLQAIRDKGIDVNYVYTMRLGRSGQPEFVVDAEEDPEYVSHIGDIYKDPTPELLAALSGQEIQVESDFSADDWGIWLSGFAPLLDDAGTPVAILGIDMSAARILSNEQTVFSSLVFISVMVSLVILAFAYVVSRRITRPLALIEADMIRIQHFEIDGSLKLNSVFREIKSINDVAEDMKQSLRSFKKYVPADLVAQLITEHQQADLGGERRDLTIFFSDIENFTSWSEMLSPEELIEVMARYFEGMTRIIMDNQGTVDKYIGDAIMAFWGAPRQNVNHARLAAKAALECSRFQQTFNDELASAGREGFNTRIGLNSGEVLVGNVGYAQRLNYTALGDHVNLASRLEGLNKFYGTRIILSHYTQDRICDEYLSRKLDCVVVKGRRRYIYVYELLAEGSGTAAEAWMASETNKACGLYFQRQWEAALAGYTRILEVSPQDQPARIMAERCRQYLDKDPGPDWEGVLVLREK